MYLKCFEYLLNNDPDKVLSKAGYRLRYVFNPILRFAAAKTSKSKAKMHIVRKAKIPAGRQVIYAPTHGFKDDVAYTLGTISDHAYILFGSLPQFYGTFDGISSWINGVIMVDRTDRDSRRASFVKMERYMSFGGNMMIFPEGVWNKSENQLILKLYPGIYRIAKEFHALIVPVATLYDEKQNIVHTILDEAVDVCDETEEEGLRHLRDAMATAKFELMETYAQDTREHLLSGKTPAQYWNDYIEFLISQVDCYDREVEDNAEFIDKRITKPEDAFAHLKTLRPSLQNAFLFRE